MYEQLSSFLSLPSVDGPPSVMFDLNISELPSVVFHIPIDFIHRPPKILRLNELSLSRNK